jgi:hypothetical protein
MGKRQCELGDKCPYQVRRACCRARVSPALTSFRLQDPHVHHQHLGEFSHDKKAAPLPKLQTGQGRKLNEGGHRLGSSGAAAAAPVASAGAKRPRDPKRAAAAAALARSGGAASGGAAAPSAAPAKAARKPPATTGGAKKLRTSGAAARPPAAPESPIDLT